MQRKLPFLSLIWSGYAKGGVVNLRASLSWTVEMSSADDTVQRFSGRVDDYIRYRPGYPVELLDILRARCGLSDQSIVADIGSGPGTSTELFLKQGYSVIGVEPNAEMRLAAESALRNYPRFKSVTGTAEATNLQEQSVDLVVAAQAFHWFDVPNARREFARLLRPPGWVALLWNTLRTDTPFLRDYESLLQRFGTDYRQVHHKNLGDEVFDKLYPHGYERRVFANVQSFDLEGVTGRLRSSSFMPREGHPQYQPMIAELQRLFSEHQCAGQVRFEYDAELFLGVINHRDHSVQSLALKL